MNARTRGRGARSVLALAGLAAVAALALAGSAALAAVDATSSAKRGTYKGATDPSGEEITVKVKKHKKVKVDFCNYEMSGKIKSGDKFSVAHNGPGGVYVSVKGEFPDKDTAEGTIPIDFLCGTEGEDWTATR